MSKLREALTPDELEQLATEYHIPSLEHNWGMNGDYGRFVDCDTGMFLTDRKPTYTEAVDSLKAGPTGLIEIIHKGKRRTVYVIP